MQLSAHRLVNGKSRERAEQARVGAGMVGRRGGGWGIHAAGGGQLAGRGLLLYSSRRKGVPLKVCPDEHRRDDGPPPLPPPPICANPGECRCCVTNVSCAIRAITWKTLGQCRGMNNFDACDRLFRSVFL